MIKHTLLLTATCLLFLHVFAQRNENKAWFFSSHTQKLNRNWDFLFDGQVRSTDKLTHVNTLLLRGAFSYNITKKHSVALGYVSKNDWEKEEKNIIYQPEHRIYQQYLFQTNLGKTEFTARARFEQRFIRSAPDDAFLFSQRARAFVAFQIPVFANKDFSKGVYVAAQDEVFVNVTNQQNINGEFFDQNRLLGSIGYRWSKKIDTEIGYYRWRQSQKDGYLSSNVYQLMITTQL